VRTPKQGAKPDLEISPSGVIAPVTKLAKFPASRPYTSALFPAKTVARWRHVFGGKGKAVVARVATQIANHPAHLAHFCD
jgi:hypothetical protein